MLYRSSEILFKNGVTKLTVLYEWYHFACGHLEI